MHSQIKGKKDTDLRIGNKAMISSKCIIHQKKTPPWHGEAARPWSPHQIINSRMVHPLRWIEDNFELHVLESADCCMEIMHALQTGNWQVNLVPFLM